MTLFRNIFFSLDRTSTNDIVTIIYFNYNRTIFSSKAVWALIFAHIGQNWGLYTLFTQVPTYLNNIQHFALEGNGMLSSLPYIFMMVLSVPFSITADWAISSNRLSLTQTRYLNEL